MESKTAIIVISHNSKDLTKSICNKINNYTKSPYDLFVVETGSKPDQIAKGNFRSIWTSDGIRMTRGFNLGIHYAIINEQYHQGEFDYDSFWLVVNDCIFDDIDTLTPLVCFIRNNKDCAQIHPYIKNSYSDWQKRQTIDPKSFDDGNTIIPNARKTSFSEIVCPLLSREIIDKNILDNRYFYGWGLDFEIPYLIHKNLKRLYISNEVGIVHNPGTTSDSGNDELFKNRTEQFKISRENMIEVLTAKWGKKWGDVFLEKIPEDVPREPFIDWVTKVTGDYEFI